MTASRSRNDDAHSCGKRQRKWALATIATRQVSANVRQGERGVFRPAASTAQARAWKPHQAMRKPLGR
ncbi:hypothetical protein LC55x_2807 [Lysobacter capsici]|nr:hypothetical protein LC55x_2807 [Lysobacter capsici]